MDALFYLCETGSQTRYVTELFGIPKATFYRYLGLIIDHHILEEFYHSIISSIINPAECLLITDTFTVKSMNGNQNVGHSSTDRGRNGTVICDTNRITHAVHIGTANTHDSKLLTPTLEKLQLSKTTKCLCDAGYVGKQLAIDCLKKKLLLIVKTKKVGKSGKMSHLLESDDVQILSKFRNRIELLNGNIRRFRGLMIKWVRTIKTYQSFLYVALLCVSVYQIVITRK